MLSFGQRFRRPKVTVIATNQWARFLLTLGKIHVCYGGTDNNSVSEKRNESSVHRRPEAHIEKLQHWGQGGIWTDAQRAEIEALLAKTSDGNLKRSLATALNRLDKTTPKPDAPSLGTGQYF